MWRHPAPREALSPVGSTCRTSQQFECQIATLLLQHRATAYQSMPSTQESQLWRQLSWPSIWTPTKSRLFQIQESKLGNVMASKAGWTKASNHQSNSPNSPATCSVGHKNLSNLLWSYVLWCFMLLRMATFYWWWCHRSSDCEPHQDCLQISRHGFPMMGWLFSPSLFDLFILSPAIHTKRGLSLKILKAAKKC